MPPPSRWVRRSLGVAGGAEVECDHATARPRHRRVWPLCLKGRLHWASPADPADQRNQGQTVPQRQDCRLPPSRYRKREHFLPHRCRHHDRSCFLAKSQPLVRGPRGRSPGEGLRLRLPVPGPMPCAFLPARVARPVGPDVGARWRRTCAQNAVCVSGSTTRTRSSPLTQVGFCLGDSILDEGGG